MSEPNRSHKAVSSLWHIARAHLSVGLSVVGLIALEALIILNLMPAIWSMP